MAKVGADAVQRPDRDEQVFVAEILTRSDILDADGTAVEIVPGMVAEADILAGRCTVLDCLTQP